MVNKNQAEGDIESLAEQAGQELLEALPDLKAATGAEKTIIIIQALHSPKTTAAKLMAAFCNDSSFGDLRGGWIQCGGIGRLMQSHVVPLFLIRGVVDGRSVKPMVDEALAFADCRMGIAETYAPLAGVALAEAVSLGEGIDLVPWGDVPESAIKWSFNSDSYSQEFPSFQQQISNVPIKGNSAIRIRGAECQVLFSSQKNAKDEIEALTSQFSEKHAQIGDVVRCIIAQSERPVAALGYWTEFDKKIANEMGVSSLSHDGTIFDNTVRSWTSSPMILDSKSFPGLFHRFVELNSSEKKVMRISLDRLCKALRGGALVDKAIDLGIALEVILLHGIDENYRGELKYRSSIRGAAFLGGNSQERLEIFKHLKSVYDLRSKAVHTGNLAPKSKNEPPHETLEKATSICAQLARKLIDRGSFPNWEDEYVVGGQGRDPDL